MLNAFVGFIFKLLIGLEVRAINKLNKYENELKAQLESQKVLEKKKQGKFDPNVKRQIQNNLNRVIIHKFLLQSKILIYRIINGALQVLITIVRFILHLMFPTIVLLFVVVIVMSSIFLIMNKHIEDKNKKRGYWEEICVSDEFEYTPEEKSMFENQMTQKQKNKYKFLENYTLALNGSITGQPLLTNLKISSRDKLMYLTGIMAIENSMNPFNKGDITAWDTKDINVNISTIPPNAAGYGLLGLRKGSSLGIGEGAGGKAGLTPEEVQKIKTHYSKYNPEAPPSNYEALYIPYGQFIVANVYEKDYLNRAITYPSSRHLLPGLTTKTRPDAITYSLAKVASDSVGGIQDFDIFHEHFKMFLAQAQYHGANESGGVMEYPAYAQLFAEFWVQTNGYKDIEIMSDKEILNESIFRLKWLGENNNYRYGSRWSYNPNATINEPFFKIKGQPITEPLLVHLHKNAKNKADFNNKVISVYNARGSGNTSGIRDRVLNFHYAISSYMLGEYFSKTIEVDYSLGQKCYWVWNDCEDEPQTLGGYTPEGTYQPGAQAKDEINIGPTGQIQGPWPQDIKEKMMQITRFSSLFGGYDEWHNLQEAEVWRQGTKWKVPYEQQTTKKPRGKLKINNTPNGVMLGTAGCHYYGLSYMASALTRTNINVAEIVAASMVTGGGSTTSLSLQSHSIHKTFKPLGIELVTVTNWNIQKGTSGYTYFTNTLTSTYGQGEQQMQTYIDEILSKGGLVMGSFNSLYRPMGSDGVRYKFPYTTVHYVVITEKTTDGRYRIAGYNNVKRDTQTFTWSDLYKAMRIGGGNNTKLVMVLPTRPVDMTKTIQTQQNTGTTQTPTQGTIREECLPTNSNSSGVVQIGPDGKPIPPGTTYQGGVTGPSSLVGWSIDKRNMAAFGTKTAPTSPTQIMDNPVFGPVFKACISKGKITESDVKNLASPPATRKKVMQCMVDEGVIERLPTQIWGYDGVERTEVFYVHKAFVNSFIAIMTRLYNEKVPVQPGAGHNMNFSNLQYRGIGGRSTSYSNHSFGTAIDFQPSENPHFTGGIPKANIFKPVGNYKPSNNKTARSMGEHHPIPNALQDYGWGWGAYYYKRGSKTIIVPDYMHFEATPPRNTYMENRVVKE